jgi:hypothetical protein
MFVENRLNAIRTPAGCNVPLWVRFHGTERHTSHPAGVRSCEISSL